jgi:uncharacterized protein YndB with AHSA1/START domain
MMKTTLLAAGLLAMSIPSAFALQASKSVDVDAAPAKVWTAIGDFCGIAQWHPAIASCAPSTKGGKHIRTLALKGGGTIVEQEVYRHNRQMEYRYTIVDGPLPVSDYQSTLKVSAHGTGSVITWNGTFKAKGADDATATNAIQGIYDSGLAALADKVK